MITEIVLPPQIIVDRNAKAGATKQPSNRHHHEKLRYLPYFLNNPLSRLHRWFSKQTTLDLPIESHWRELEVFNCLGVS